VEVIDRMTKKKGPSFGGAFGNTRAFRSRASYSQRLGRCYELAGNAVLDEKDWKLVHGSIQGFGNPRLGHAWALTDDGRVYEAVFDEFWPAKAFANFFSPIEDAVYDFDAMATNMLTTSHWGPWSEERSGI
jgi:hypothetical protein